MAKHSISVLIIAANEEKNIRPCLESVKWADEIILVDANSSDNTCAIASEYTDKIFIKEWEGFAQQRKFSLGLASKEWILSIDADERVSMELKTEIEKLLETGPCCEAYFIPRRNYFLDKIIRTCNWYPDYQLRLLKRKRAFVTDRKVHEGFETTGEKGYLQNDIIHHTHQSIAETISKINSYSTLEAMEKSELKRVKGIDLLLHPLAAFLNHYISRRGFKDGIHGLMVSLLHAITNMLTYMKIWELQRKDK